MEFKRGIERHPVIAALRSEEDLEVLRDYKPGFCFLLFGEINTLRQMVKRVKDMGKKAYLHVDLAQGFGNDRATLQYIKREIQPDGVVSTRTHLIRFAREEGLFAIQRLFIPDSMSVKTGQHLIKQSRADAVEVMPGVVPAWVFQTLREKSDIPIVAGGLLRGEDDVKAAFRNGADAVSVSKRELWNIEEKY
ncbi:glycerol-3-phosphate responsive antiterminator [Paludifilum halophilum]|uniref:Glycerol uptake operon antiterminator regulatory protein n=1 Tax=Paludifilum halophilum TaxID=1642702 RepID=A0A235B323_9BACL|nr:glycerol-3-phosphate responsive antiterminator [Paludifilum halophilum]OYD06684.1 hypothetical protein CHM34_15410 [Paludifilum halophilum]